MSRYYAILHQGDPGNGWDNIVSEKHLGFDLHARLVPGGFTVDSDRRLNFVLARPPRPRVPFYVSVWDGPTLLSNQVLDLGSDWPTRQGDVLRTILQWTGVSVGEAHE